MKPGALLIPYLSKMEPFLKVSHLFPHSSQRARGKVSSFSNANFKLRDWQKLHLSAIRPSSINDL